MSGRDADRWSDEPDEFDPDSLGPEVPSPPEPESPGPEIPSPPDPDGIDSEIAGPFWKLVVVFNAALLALSLGSMFVVFRGQWDLGLRILAVGVIASAYGVVRYYRFRARMAERSSDDPEQNG